MINRVNKNMKIRRTNSNNNLTTELERTERTQEPGEFDERSMNTESLGLRRRTTPIEEHKGSKGLQQSFWNRQGITKVNEPLQNAVAQKTGKEWVRSARIIHNAAPNEFDDSWSCCDSDSTRDRWLKKAAASLRRLCNHIDQYPLLNSKLDPNWKNTIEPLAQSKKLVEDYSLQEKRELFYAFKNTFKRLEKEFYPLWIIDSTCLLAFLGACCSLLILFSIFTSNTKITYRGRC